MSLFITDGMAVNQPISFGNTSATWNMHTYFLFYHFGSRLDEKDCCNWGRKDRLTALKSQTMTFKSSDVGEKALRCHKSEVLAAFTVGFLVIATWNIANLQSRQLSRLAFCYHFKLQRIVTGRYLVIFAQVLKYANAMIIWQLLMSGRSSGGLLLRSFTVSLHVTYLLEIDVELDHYLEESSIFSVWMNLNYVT